ncbi:MAG: glycosyltransferase [Truepera sp.]|nr:glycosyltransferase [Truepera sp.]
MAVLLILLYTLILPYLALIAAIVRGMFLPPNRSPSRATPSVSVIVPAHNEAENLSPLLNSLATQDYPGALEFVVVDDRSHDGTGEIVREMERRDPRFRCVRVQWPNRRLSPKVNAVEVGIRTTRGELIFTTDADCEVPAGWVSGMVSHFEPDVAMVAGCVESSRPHQPHGWTGNFEAVDWFSLMLTMRSMLRFGWPYASTANNQAYRRRAFEAIGGFGSFGRAPSGDEDLLTQRLGRLEGFRVAIADDPATRVLTRSERSLGSLLRQRRRWVSRYHHPMHYHPGFLAGLTLLGLQSVVLTLALLAIPFVPALAPWVLSLWAVKLALELFGMNLGLAQLGRHDLTGLPVLLWAALHPPFIATVSVWSLIRPGDWRSSAPGYRRRYLRRRLRELRRKVLVALDLS